MKVKQEVFDYLKTQRVGVLAVEMPDGSPHGATLHFAHTENPLEFFFVTKDGSRKSRALSSKKVSSASFVVGTDEKDMRTLQLDGEVKIVNPEDHKMFEEVYFSKLPDKKGKFELSEVVTFTFIPTWWRFTDWTTPKGKVILSSED